MAERVGQVERLIQSAADVHSLLVEVAGQVEFPKVAVDLPDAGKGAGQGFRIRDRPSGFGGLREGGQGGLRLVGAAGCVAVIKKCAGRSLGHGSSW
jgi:hypothetical protein